MNEFRINIIRIYNGKNSIMGEFYINGTLLAMSLELPWKDNIEGISCIPEGKYSAILRYDKSRDGFFTIQLSGTGPRTGIQIHVGNKPAEIAGCILLGTSAKYKEEIVGDSKKAIALLKKAFYESENPILTPNKEISVSITSLPYALRFYPIKDDTSFYFVFNDGYWQGVNTTDAPAPKYKEILRDTKWIISKSEDGGSFNGRFVRWGTLGNTAFQISKDLKDWKTLAPDELVIRDPKSNIEFWEVLKKNGINLIDLILFQKYEILGGDGYGDDDGERDGVITYDFDDPAQPDYEGPEEVTVDMNETDTRDDYSGYDDDYSGNDGD